MTDIVMILLDEDDLLLGKLVEDFHVVASEEQLRPFRVCVPVHKQVEQDGYQMWVEIGLHFIDHRHATIREYWQKKRVFGVFAPEPRKRALVCCNPIGS